MISGYIKYKKRALELRAAGFTYGDIRNSLKVKIPKSTLSCWFKDLNISVKAQRKLRQSVLKKLKKAQEIAVKANKEKRKNHLNQIKDGVAHLGECLNNQDIAKIALAMLYLGEGAKGVRRSFMLGNSDPRIIRLYLGLLRRCYFIDESKFRCTLQCRADQDIAKLEKFWSDITRIPLSQFYVARVDQRTIGKKSKKPEYKGVCRIDYFSADVYNEIEKIIEVICGMGL